MLEINYILRMTRQYPGGKLQPFFEPGGADSSLMALESCRRPPLILSLRNTRSQTPYPSLGYGLLPTVQAKQQDAVAETVSKMIVASKTLQTRLLSEQNTGCDGQRKFAQNRNTKRMHRMHNRNTQNINAQNRNAQNIVVVHLAALMARYYIKLRRGCNNAAPTRP